MDYIALGLLATLALAKEPEQRAVARACYAVHLRSKLERKRVKRSHRDVQLPSF